MINEKKIDLTLDLNKMLKQEIKNSKYIKYGIIATSVIGGILAVGFAMKVFTYTAKNYMALKNTFKQ